MNSVQDNETPAQKKAAHAEYDKRVKARGATKKPVAKKTYPWAVNAMGQGFRNLYDALSTKSEE